MANPVTRLMACLVLTARAASPLDAQTIKGTIVDEGSKLPVMGVLITIADDAGTEALPGVRSDSVGNFIVHAARAGTWRVKAMRIGYAPVTSDPVSLAVGSLAVVRLRMTTVAQQLLPVQVIEQRMLNANELMSTAGFDLRESRGLGKFLSGQRLADMGLDGLREILDTQFQPTLYIYNDPVIGDVLRMRQGSRQCAPEVFLDGRLLATAPKPSVVVDGPPPRTRMDSVRAQARAESEQSRVGFDQVSALTLLSSLTAEALHGIEVYRSTEVPPASLGAWFGMTKASVGACGSVAVWTKAGARSVVAERPSSTPGRAVQVISGTLLDVDTGTPLARRAVSLLSETRDPIGRAVMTDEHGDFTVRTGRVGPLRLSAGGDGYLVSTTPVFTVTTNELVIVKLFVSARTGVLAPLGVAARVLPQQIGGASIAGFTYRRERAQGGTFFGVTDVERTGARSLADLVRTVDGVSVSDASAPGAITMTGGCAPAMYLDGRLVAGTALVPPLDQVFGVEVYARATEVPVIYADGRGCGVIVVWSKR